MTDDPRSLEALTTRFEGFDDDEERWEGFPVIDTTFDPSAGGYSPLGR